MTERKVKPVPKTSKPTKLVQKYHLTVSREQALMIQNACEFFARLRCGQLEEILYALVATNLEPNQIEKIRSLLVQLKKTIYPDLTKDSSYGIYETDKCTPAAQLAFDIYQVIRHSLAWDDNPSGGNTVNFHKPSQVGKTPLPDIESVTHFLL